jgi:hypothetical protein
VCQSELLIFESILTTFKLSTILKGSSVNWLLSEIEPPYHKQI